ncbi:major Facilitator Superfamily protein [Geobacter sp. OR-1]|uniref:MFS transporter n=1 Tax=Geobacter sp. OR-1 TaxID=1266765 RepID=UPI0005439A22|nr:MFS transporter [Geobacter sp. OR-1]GAM10278.1 major Facilitator Superfamily protein [Geobacter sp. OR-1]
MKAADWSSIPSDRRSAMRSAIFAQCFGMLSQQMISGGILLLYLNAMGMKPAVILLVLNITPFLSSFLSIPVAWGADRAGIKRFGNLGNFLMILGLSFVVGGAFLRDAEPSLVLPAILAGLVIHMFGAAFFNTGWFSLLSHIVPSEYTGRFFGVIRFSWQIVSLAFFILSAFLFSARTPIWIYQTVLCLGGLSVGCRYFFYKDIPNAPAAESKPLNLIKSVEFALTLPGFAPYLAYLLLLVCVTGNGQDMLRLSAVRGCGLGDNQILFLTVGSMLGSLTAFKFMGRLIDRLGPRRVFLLCHIGFAVALLSFPARVLFHLPPLAAGVFTSMILGLTSSTLGLTTTSQSFQICRGAQRTIAYALVSATQSMGSGLSGFALAALLSHMGTSVPGGNPFDLILIGLGVFILVQIAGLRLLADKREGTDRIVVSPVVS